MRYEVVAHYLDLEDRQVKTGTFPATSESDALDTVNSVIKNGFKQSSDANTAVFIAPAAVWKLTVRRFK